MGQCFIYFRRGKKVENERYVISLVSVGRVGMVCLGQRKLSDIEVLYTILIFPLSLCSL